MKRIICIFISALLMLSAFSTVFASSDIQGHWAEEQIRFLLEKRIVNGDEKGNINPDGEIRRCEFVKVVNIAFSYNSEDEENYPDVDEKSWYFKEFLKARKAGYLKGDEKGNVNPEKTLTRAEGAVILARIIGLGAEKSDKEFTDELPSWAENEIRLMAENNFIKGYEDGSFRAYSVMKRCEAFSIISAIIKANDKNDEVKEENKEVKNNNGDISGMTVSNPVSTGKRPSGGGGGGGGSSSSGGSANVKLNPPLIKFFENDILSWTEVRHSKGYEIAVSMGEKTVNDIVETEEADISVYAAELTKDSVESSAEILVSVRAIGSGSYKTSEYTEPFKFEYRIFDPESSSDLGMKLVFSPSDEGKEEYFLEFPEGINLVSLKKAEESKSIENPVSPLNITEFVSDENGIVEEAYVFMARKGEDIQIINDSLAYGGGAGTDEEPYIIACERHFRNIKKNPSSVYCQVSSFEITKTDETVFEGSYDGNGEKIILNIDGEKYSALFGKIRNAELKNISAEGTVNASDIYAGSICGYAEMSVITNCESSAVINLVGENLKNGAYSGGITGFADGDTVISDCVFNGTITSEAGIIGGIAGESSGEITGCINNGEITASNTVLTGSGSYAGGIAGIIRGSGKVTECENNGNVSNHYQAAQNAVTNFVSYTGGIVGVAPYVKDCINGKNAKISSLVKSGVPANVSGYQNVGGIAGRLESEGIVENCDNYGVTETPGDSVLFWVGGIVGYSRGRVISCGNYASGYTGRQYGGLVGRCLGTVSQSFNKCPINAVGYAGGIAARIDAGCVIEYCYNIGSISGRYGGGFSGSAGSAAPIIRNSYSAPEGTCTNGILAYNQKVSLSDVYFVKKGSETFGANSEAKEITLEELNSDEIISVLNGTAEEPVFVKGENGYPELAANPEKEAE